MMNSGPGKEEQKLRQDWKQQRESQLKKRVRRAGLVLFLLYLGILAYYLFFADWYDHAPGAHFSGRKNFVPFVEIRRSIGMLQEGYTRGAFLNLFGNIVGFLPFGFCLPVITRRLRSFWKVTALGLCFSLAVEVIQLLSRAGRFDIDDVILNTIGAAMGYLLFLQADYIRREVMYRHGG